MTELTKGLSSIARNPAFLRLIDLLEQVDTRRSNVLGVLTYHRVDEPDADQTPTPGLISATPDVFEQQMSYLATNYSVISIPELLNVYQNGGILPPRAVMVTFDDAYSDFAEHAWPILKRYQVPVTLFVPTGFPDHPERAFWWDRLYQAVSSATDQGHINTPLGRLPAATEDQQIKTYKQLRNHVKTLSHVEAMTCIDQICDELGAPQPANSVLSWDALRQLAREGVVLGAHTRYHPLLNRIPPEQVEAEVIGSLQELEGEIGPSPPIFAYPSGGYNSTVKSVLESAGIALAFATKRGINDLRKADRLRLRRINIGQRTTLAALRAQLLPWLAYLNR